MANVYFEHHQIGQYFKTIAIDGATGREVSVSGPIKTPQHMREKLALKKLMFVLSKQ